MQITSLSVQHVRAHQQYTLSVAPDTTVITGANGSGKTSLLEALYVALQGSSFKGGDSDMLRRGESWYRIDVALEDGTVRTVKFDSGRATGRKQFIVDDKTFYRLPAQHRYPLVLFEPDDLRLLHGSPERRRRFVDRFLSQLDPQYSVALRRYERALRQRNSLLKQQASVDALFAWNVSLSDYGAYLIEKRLQLIERLNRQLGGAYESIAHSGDSVSLSYSAQCGKDIRQQLLAQLHQATARDMLLGSTSIGPHRHDVLFSFNNSPALSVASRGEVRSIVLALKFLEVDIIEEVAGKKPIVLLDDVFSELDEGRQAHLTRLTHDSQVLLTSTSASAASRGSVVAIAS